LLAQKADSTNHVVQMIPAEKGVSLEVLDWGGTGRPLILLTGLADSAHIFDEFAPRLTAKYHIYGVSRRGRGASSKPEPNDKNYSSSRLGEDVLAVIDALHLNKPVLIGHSIAGEELSYIGSNQPGKVSGLVYLEATYPYALYDQVNGELELDAIELRKQLRLLINGYAYEPVKGYNDLIANLERVEKEIAQHEQDMKNFTPTPISPRMTPDLFAIMEGREKFTAIHVPALVIIGVDPNPISGDGPQSKAQAERQALVIRDKKTQIETVKRQLPSARLVLIPHASHYVFQSNEAEVLREINGFLATLPPTK
jgi:non-heme chloroperoxidase